MKRRCGYGKCEKKVLLNLLAAQALVDHIKAGECYSICKQVWLGYLPCCTPIQPSAQQIAAFTGAPMQIRHSWAYYAHAQARIPITSLFRIGLPSPSQPHV